MLFKFVDFQFEDDQENNNIIRNSSFKILEINNKKKLYKIMAKEDVLCTVIPDFAFIEVFGIDYKNVIVMSFLKETLCKINYFNMIIQNNSLREVAKLFNLHQYRCNELLSSDEDNIVPKKIIIILDGTAKKIEK